MWALEKRNDFAVKIAKELKEQNTPFVWVKEDEDGVFNFPDEQSISSVTNMCGSVSLANFLGMDEEFCLYDYNEVSWVTEKHFFNEGHIYVKKKVLLESFYKVFSHYAKNAKVFIRPNSTQKQFTGRLFDLQEFNLNIPDFEVLDDDDVLVVAKPKDIIGEWRVVCHQKKVVTSSLYLFQGLYTQVKNLPANAVPFVKEVLNLEKMDNYKNPFVMDIAMVTPEEFKVLEFNALHTSCLYECDPKKIIEL